MTYVPSMPPDTLGRAQAGKAPFALHARELGARGAVVTLEGDLELASAPRLKWGLIDLVESGRSRLVIDLSAVTFMDSTALGVLIGLERRLGEGGSLAIVCTRRSVLKVFEITGLDKKLALFSAVDEALAHVDET